MDATPYTYIHVTESRLLTKSINVLHRNYPIYNILKLRFFMQQAVAETLHVQYQTTRSNLMEKIERNEQIKSQRQDNFKFKEDVGPEEVKIILREWLNALEEDRDLQLKIKGESFTVPKLALVRGRTQAEYEFKKGEYELELELKWKNSDLTDQ
jgi:hypothetical protein